MNERIGQLAGQALDKVVPYTWTRLDYDEIQKLQEYFAELIVKECIDTLEKRFMGDLNREDQEVHRCIEDLKKHFGANRA
jgi:hypothetical protein